MLIPFPQTVPLIGATVLAAALVATGVAGAAGAPQNKKAKNDPVPTMTVQIFNSSSNYNIYPVIEAGGPTGVGPDDWLQAFFQVKNKDIGSQTYRRGKTFRIYVNPTGNGIPPKTSVTVTLPLLTQLVPDAEVDPTKPDQFVNWWKGGRTYIYDAPSSANAPPAALVDQLTKRPKQSEVPTPDGATVPVCVADKSTAPCVEYQLYVDDSGLGNNQPSQLLEYTLGAAPPTGAKGPNQAYYTFNDFNVDYDVSFVNNAYLPVAMGVLDNKHVGYIGTVQPIDTFRVGMNRFIKAYPNWPRYVGDDKKPLATVKLASPLEVLLLAPAYNGLSPVKSGNPVNTLVKNWKACVKGFKATARAKSTGKTKLPKQLKSRLAALPAGYCDAVMTFRKLFKANYDNYASTFAKEPSCSGKPQSYSEDLLIQHVYGWTPFNFFCADSRYNLLANTPPDYSKNNFAKYQEVKSLFDKWQRADKGPSRGVFDPWVLLVHDSAYLNSPNAYAYSVDDALGNMQADGDGIVISVGGKDGLPVPTPAVPPIIVSFGAPTKAGSEFTHFGACEDPPNREVDPNYFSFIISPNEADQCVLTLLDNATPPVVYKFGLKKPAAGKSLLPFPPRPADGKPIPDANRAPINCDDASSSATKAWCRNTVFAYSEYDPQANGYIHHIAAGAAIDPSGGKVVRK
jgi:hypothetical protein